MAASHDLFPYVLIFKSSLAETREETDAGLGKGRSPEEHGLAGNAADFWAGPEVDGNRQFTDHAASAGGRFLPVFKVSSVPDRHFAYGPETARADIPNPAAPSPRNAEVSFASPAAVNHHSPQLVGLRNVAFVDADGNTANDGDSGSSITWAWSIAPTVNVRRWVSDVDGDGLLEQGTDVLLVPDQSLAFTGYTITRNDKTFPVFAVSLHRNEGGRASRASRRPQEGGGTG